MCIHVHIHVHVHVAKRHTLSRSEDEVGPRDPSSLCKKYSPTPLPGKRLGLERRQHRDPYVLLEAMDTMKYTHLSTLS